MLDTLITSKTRIKLLLKFFLNPENSSYLRNLESEFGDSSNAIRLELNKLEKADMLLSELQGNKKIFKVNKKHPLFEEINRLIKKQLGITTIIENVVARLGDLDAVYLTGDLAQGKKSEYVDMVFVGEIDQDFLLSLIKKAEKRVGKKVRYEVRKEKIEGENEQFLLLWSKEKTNGSQHR